MPSTPELYGLTRSQLQTLVADWGFSGEHANKLWSELYRYGKLEIPRFDLPERFHVQLQQAANMTPLRVHRRVHSTDGLTQKFALSLADDLIIESVLMQFRERTTACLSTQVGCPLACTFCATGHMGWTRNLTVSEIVAQAMFIDSQSQQTVGQRLRNLVLMGMGEPLLNYEAVMSAMEILCDPAGLAIAHKRVTLSTVGVVPGIYRLAQERRPYSLAVSLHAATQEERLALLPIARTWPLSELMEACREYVAQTQRKIFFEWTLIAGKNDSVLHAEQLTTLVRELNCQVNLIPLNPIADYEGSHGEPDAVSAFQAVLLNAGIPTTIRQRRGIDIAAGCGQLAAVEIGSAVR
jgi:23S rRNA (adenine2503-C2)-methyltransferase